MTRTLYARPQALKPTGMHYCAGCGHGVVHRIIAELLDELGIREKTVGIAPVGCAVLAYDYLNCDISEAAHGRAPAVATGMKRANPDNFVFCYQGDGDLASIGAAEIVHAANRGENVSFIFMNNAIYGMTMGQMAPTTLPGQRTATTPLGRDTKLDGYPLRVCELLATLEGACYLERTTVTSPPAVRKTKNAIRKAFQAQLDGKGFALVEVLSPCPSRWGMSPVDALKFVDEEMTKFFPLGVCKKLKE